ncbi:hypothetical protein BH23ACT10_BH23ACT10_07420 [soil metagenome]
MLLLEFGQPFVDSSEMLHRPYHVVILSSS